MPATHHRVPSLVGRKGVDSEDNRAEDDNNSTASKREATTASSQPLTPVTITGHGAGTSTAFAGALSSASGMGSGSVSFSFVLPELEAQEVQQAMPEQPASSKGETDNSVERPEVKHLIQMMMLQLQQQQQQQKQEVAASPLRAFTMDPQQVRTRRSRSKRIGLRRWLMKKQVASNGSAAAAAAAAAELETVAAEQVKVKAGVLSKLRVDTSKSTQKARRPLLTPLCTPVKPGLCQWVKAQNENTEARILDAARPTQLEAAEVTAAQRVLFACAVIVPLMLLLLWWLADSVTAGDTVSNCAAVAPATATSTTGGQGTAAFLHQVVSAALSE